MAQDDAVGADELPFPGAAVAQNVLRPSSMPTSR